MDHPMLIFFTFLFCVALGFVSELFIMFPLKKWYATVRKPPSHPKNSIDLIARSWTISYGFMGIAVYFILSSDKPHILQVIMFLLQLILCFTWPIIYFYKKNMKLALTELQVLLAISILTTISFFMVSIPAGVLLLPCIPWIGYMTNLNKKVLKMNTEE